MRCSAQKVSYEAFAVSYEARVFGARPYHRYLVAAGARGIDSYHESGGPPSSTLGGAEGPPWLTVDIS